MNSFRSISVLLCVLLSVLTAGGHLTAYSYDIHGRLTASEPVPSGLSGSLVPPDIGTEYNYDRNANITSISRRGIIDIVGGKKVYGLHDALTMTYSGNRLMRMEIVSDGAEYEGRTGVSLSGVMTAFAYDSNGNMTADPSRGIARIRYDRLDKPVEVTFAGGHRQTVSYDGFGRKIRVDYAQGPASVIGGDLPADGDYEVTLSRVYAGAHVFCDGRLEYSGFPGGYFDSSGSPRYYITDWQGNNAAVVDKAGNVVQKTTYYPYGEPTIEPEGQRYLFGGKAREHAGGRNSYDFGARSLTPYARWSTPDPLADKFYPISPYSYCGGDPINNIDLWGLETLALSEDSVIQKYAENVPDDPQKLIIYSHGNYSGFDNDIKEKDGTVCNASDFIEAVKESSVEFNDIENQIGLEIELKSCNAGADNPNGKPNIANKISYGLPNLFVTGPNGRMKTHYTINKKNGKITKLYERVLDQKNRPMPGNKLTTTYFRGQKIDPGHIPAIRSMLRLQSRPIIDKIIPPLLKIK